MIKSLAFTSLFAAAIATPIVVTTSCGPASRPDNFGGGHVDSNTSVAPEICNDMIDNDGDGLVDCSDPDCSGIDGCPVCGQVETLQGSGIALPDGVGSGYTCSTDAQCTAANAPGAPNCVFKECHASYTSLLNFVGFGQGATLDDTSKLLKVCAKLEHSWLRDLQVELIAPSGQTVALKKFMDRNGDEVYLGHANDADTAAHPVPGVGYDYCWTAGPTATTTMLNATMEDWNSHSVVPAGDYIPDVPFTALQGATLNGMWEFRVTDLWPEDNGFLFDWTINFDPSLVSDCAGPIIE